MPKVLLANANGEDDVEENLATLGLKSRVSEDLFSFFCFLYFP